ncbi:MAG TPA: tetratricopeptide repeat protein, partial [Ignavibacteriaceae bacterium]|nr:tetratricopeptide repeat protein [Ignavibacteriaceae bacterium]
MIFLSFTGCGIWENFTTYFNLYYNTKDIFDQAESTIYQEKKPLFSTNELIIPGSVNQDLSKVIEKCSALLQFHSESSYVDEALMMLGKCFYYQKNYQKALRKFQELLATQPESDLVIETRLWIGKTQMKLRDYENALSTLQALRT